MCHRRHILLTSMGLGLLVGLMTACTDTLQLFKSGGESTDDVIVDVEPTPTEEKIAIVVPTEVIARTSPIPIITPTRLVWTIQVSNIPILGQQQRLTCEEAAAAMATRGKISEAQLLAVLPRSDNPFVGIRGRTDGTIGGIDDYGIYAQPLQKSLNKLGVKTDLLYQQKYEDFKNTILAHLRADHAIVFWTTWRESMQTPVEVRISDGSTVKLVPFEHTGVIVGASDKGLYYHDPFDATIRHVTWADHKRVSGYFDNMALVFR